MKKLNLQQFALRRPTPPTAGAQPGAQAAPTPPPHTNSVPAGNVDMHAPTPPTPPAPPAPPAPAQSQAPAVVNNSGKPAMMDFHNQGGETVLEGFDEWNGGNYVTVDGSDFYIKSTETRVRDLTVIVSFARQYYRWFDKDNNEWHEAPNKVDKRYSLAAELKWLDYVEGEEEPKEFSLTLATTSTIQFREYVQKLRDSGTRINGIWTRMTIERLERIDPETKEKQRYSRVKFENAGPVVYDQAAQ